MQRIITFTIDAASIKIFCQNFLDSIYVMDTENANGTRLKLSENFVIHKGRTCNDIKTSSKMRGTTDGMKS
jgi:hypothetical protein